MPIRIDTMNEDDIAAVTAIDGPTQVTEGQLRAEFERNWSRLWVAREGSAGDAAEGVAAFLIAWHVADEFHVLNVATREDLRRRGIARALMDHVIAHARSARVKHVLLEVRRSNTPAIALYRKLGFFATGVRARYYQDDEDAVEMMLAFDVETGEILPRDDEVNLLPS
jgi:[ribosomal protein S18]-alanine N-acetyltransferase